MQFHNYAPAFALAVLPSLALGQVTTHPVVPPPATVSPVANPVAQSIRDYEAMQAKNLIAAAEEFPADKYGFKPTPAQMTVADIVVHLSQGNDFLCGNIAGVKAPTRSKITAAAPKDSLVARLKETFAFCTSSLAAADDSKLSEMVPWFGGRTVTRASMITATAADYADHYSQLAIYLRLNGLLPPTAKRP